MADMTELKNAIRIGTVQSVSAEKMTALHIIKRPVYVIPAMESGTEGQTAKTELQYDYGGELKKKVSHYHEAFVSAWVPDVNDMVLCIMLPDGDGDGFIVGEV